MSYQSPSPSVSALLDMSEVLDVLGLSALLRQSAVISLASYVFKDYKRRQRGVVSFLPCVSGYLSSGYPRFYRRLWRENRRLK